MLPNQFCQSSIRDRVIGVECGNDHGALNARPTSAREIFLQRSDGVPRSSEDVATSGVTMKINDHASARVRGSEREMPVEKGQKLSCVSRRCRCGDMPQKQRDIFPACGNGITRFRPEYARRSPHIIARVGWSAMFTWSGRAEHRPGLHVKCANRSDRTSSARTAAEPPRNMRPRVRILDQMQTFSDPGERCSSSGRGYRETIERRQLLAYLSEGG